MTPTNKPVRPVRPVRPARRNISKQKYPANTLPATYIPWKKRPIAGNDRKQYDEWHGTTRERPTDSDK